jgi:hypothetical protein
MRCHSVRVLDFDSRIHLVAKQAWSSLDVERTVGTVRDNSVLVAKLGDPVRVLPFFGRRQAVA